MAKNKSQKTTPKILIWDVETSYVRARIWHTGKQYVGHDQIIDGDRTKIICVSYKWVGEKRVHCLQWNNRTQNCDSLVRKFSKVIEKADVAIAHNGDKFDVRQYNTQCLMAGERPVSWPTTEDTLKQIRRIFYLPSYRLDYITKMLFGEGKNPMSRQDWVNVIEGKNQKIRDKALKKMVMYCKKDTALLERTWLKLAPYLEPKASRSILKNGHREGCPNCGSSKLYGHGFRTTKAGRYKRFRCESCGHSFKSHKMEKQKLTKTNNKR